ncbi:hypothetical protein [Eubacterium aggregans]|uniref:hypothetical protein n=1 Tax=Eubacterium aggregans TaxID=81409 RepID=UPI003F2D48FF
MWDIRKKVSGLNIAQIFTDYQQTYFTIATSIYQVPAYNNRQGRAALNINRFAYTAVDPEGDAECYIMRDNGGTRVMYDENNPETWPRYGETINVRYKIKNKLDRSDEAFPMRIETQLAGGESSLTPNSLNVYTESGGVKHRKILLRKIFSTG